jgi:hypothetical protein
MSTFQKALQWGNGCGNQAIEKHFNKTLYVATISTHMWQ